MLDGRVKTLHPRVHGGILADRRLAAHREQLAAAGIEPFELVVVNLYPFAAAAERALRGELDLDGLVEEIDIGGPSMVRAAAKNHASRGDRHGSRALRRRPGGPRRGRSACPPACGRRSPSRRSGTPPPTTPGSPRCCPQRMAAEGVALPDEPGLPGAADPYPARLTVTLERVETLRYGENPHQPAARYRRPGAAAADGPFATGAPPLQGKALSYNNVLDGSAAAGIARLMRGPACVIVKHTNPCGAAERAHARGRLGRRPRRRPGLRLRRGRRPHPAGRPRGRRAAGEHLPRGRRRARRSSPAALEVLAAKPNLRLVVDPALGAELPRLPPRRARPARCGTRRRGRPRHRAGHGPGRSGRPGRWPRSAPRRTPSAATSTSPGAWSAASPRTRSSSSATGCSSGSARARPAGSTPPARRWPRRRRCSGPTASSARPAPRTPSTRSRTPWRSASTPASTAFAQPGGSLRDADAIAAADAAGAAMLLTGVRHFRH